MPRPAHLSFPRFDGAAAEPLKLQGLQKLFNMLI